LWDVSKAVYLAAKWAFVSVDEKGVVMVVLTVGPSVESWVA